MILTKDDYDLLLKAVQYTLQFGGLEKNTDSMSGYLWRGLKNLEERIKNRDKPVSHLLDSTGKRIIL